MAYATTNPPACIVPAISGTGASIFTYSSADAAATVDTAGYITNAGKLGMKVGDIVYVTNTTASPNITTIHRVVTVSATTFAADLSDAGATIQTNTD